MQFVRAVDLFAKGHDDEALHLATAVESTTARIARHVPSKYNIYSGILRGNILFSMRRYLEAASVLADVKRKLNLITRPPEEVKYLHNFVSYLGLAALSALPADSASLITPSMFNSAYPQVDLEKVPAHIKRKFPMR
jgi:hypothetical protein